MASRKSVVFVFAIVLVTLTTSNLQSQTRPPLDYEFYRYRVEPIFLKKRIGHARCYTCHSESNNAFRLEKLQTAAGVWTDQQSRRNFENVSTLVNPGDLETSRLLQQPLAPEGGGNVFHSGGRQLGSKR